MPFGRGRAGSGALPAGALSLGPGESVSLGNPAPMGRWRGEPPSPDPSDPSPVSRAGAIGTYEVQRRRMLLIDALFDPTFIRMK